MWRDVVGIGWVDIPKVCGIFTMGRVGVRVGRHAG